MIYKDAKPNNAHLSLAKLEEMGKLRRLSRRIDGLQQRAGSKRVLELHVCSEEYCMNCKKSFIGYVLECQECRSGEKCGGYSEA